MELTNEHNLPEVFRNFDKATPHSTEGAKYSVTTLIDSPKISSLRRKHAEQLSEDVTDRVWAIFGTAIHKILEVGASEGEISEQRFHAQVGGVGISGQIDLQTPTSGGFLLSDYKTCRTYTIQANPKGKPEWELQLNCYAQLARLNGVEVAGIEVIAICRDWSEAGRERSEDYPIAPIVRIPVPLWEPEKAQAYLEARVALHESPEVAPCSDAEMWTRPPVYAVYTRTKTGELKKRATRLFDSRTDAEVYLMDHPGGEVIEREAVYARCNGNFCNVRDFCDTYYGRINNGDS